MNEFERAARLADDTYPFEFLLGKLTASHYALLCSKSAFVVVDESQMENLSDIWVDGFIMEKVGDGIDVFSGRQKWCLKFSPMGLPLKEAEKFIGPFEAVTFKTALEAIWPKGPAISHQQHG